jgi:hypothetical protein
LPADTHCHARAGDTSKQGVGSLAGAAHPDAVVTGHRQDIADLSSFQLAPQPGIGTVDLIAGHPSRRDPGVQRTGQHPRGQLGLGRKPHLVRDAGRLQEGRIVGPGPGQVQLPVDHGMPGIGGVHQVDRHLGVLDPPSGAGVLALHAHGGGALLEIAGLVDDQHRLWVAQVLDEIGAHVVADRVVVPHRPSEQVLHPIRARIPGVLGDRPAVLARQVRQQSAHKRPSPPPQIHPTKPSRDPAQQLLQPCLPPRRVYLYAVACGHRPIFGCRHNTR